MELKKIKVFSGRDKVFENKIKEKISLIEISEPTKHGITIEFPFTISLAFDLAVKAAKNFSTFEQYGEDKKRHIESSRWKTNYIKLRTCRIT